MIPGKYNIVCPQGSTFIKQMTWKINDTPVDLTGYTARMQVRERHTSKTPIVTLTTENGGIVLGEENGSIIIGISSDDTQDMYPKTYVYDLELISSSSIVTRLIEGSFNVTPEVTR